jgi:hypothetical protein
MKPLRVTEHEGGISLLLDCGTTTVDGAIRDAGHEPNGYFWEGIAQLFVRGELAELDGAFSFDPEAGMFCANGEDRAALERLGAAMAIVANDPAKLVAMIEAAKADGFAFDD